jgi:hypothetical protein
MTVGRCEMTLGLNAKKKRALALPHPRRIGPPAARALTNQFPFLSSLI